jgi:RNA polymerase sigma-70 factor (ECF subfamily)
MGDPGEITQLLEAASAGDPHALDRVIPLVYEELQTIARGQLAGERADHTLDTGGLVHEAYLKLVGLERMEWGGRPHFLAVAAGAMRRILIDHARSRQAAKRGGGMVAISLGGVATPVHDPVAELLELDEALRRLQNVDDRQARVVELRFFAGMTIEEVAEVLAVSPMTVKRDWTAARAWLNRELAG